MTCLCGDVDEQVLADLASRMSSAGPVQQMMAKMGAATKVILIVVVVMILIVMIIVILIVVVVMIMVIMIHDGPCARPGI